MTRPYRYYSVLALLVGVLLLFGCDRTPSRTTAFVRTLDNGLRLVAEESRGGGVACLSVHVGDGALYETAGTAGRAHLLSLLMFGKTPTRSDGEIRLLIEDTGGGLSSSVQLDYVAYNAIFPADRIADVAELLADGLFHTEFDEETFETGRARAVLAATEPLERPIDRAHQAVLGAYFGDHPYGRRTVGTPQSVSSLTFDALVTHYRRTYVPSNMVVSVAGDIDARREIDRLESLFSGAPPGEPAEPTAGSVREPVGSRVVLSGDGHVASMVLAFPAPGVGDPYDVALDVLLVAAGRTGDSRLRSALAGEAGLATAIEAGWYTRKQPSPFFIWMTLPPANVEAAEAKAVEVLAAMADKPISEEDLEQAKMLLEVGYDLDRERAGMMALLNAYWVWVAGEDFWSDYRAGIHAVTAEDVRAAAETYFSSGRHATALVLPDWTQ